jgi:serine/threonine-protein kinase
MTNILAVRAAMFPSAPRRTVLIGVSCVLAIATGLVILHTRIEARPPASPLAVALVGTLIWGGVGVATSGLTSAVIYGLSDRVRAAVELGQYRLVEKIGEGGMGRVYRAKHALLRRPTAVKMLPADRNTEEDLVRFEREVQLTSRLSHPNVVAVYDFGRSPAGVFYYAMELLEGVDLAVLVDVDGPQQPARVRHILRQAADALAEAHAIGLIHRDVKPANMVLSERRRRCDELKIVDFGLVKNVSSTTGVGKSDLNVLKGTPLYMAPEAILNPDEIDGRTDLYALGAVGYFLLTGVPLFEGHSVVEVCGQHVHAEVVPMERRSGRPVPAKLDAIILRCVAKKKEDRFADADALLAALDAADDVPPWSDAEARAWWSTHGNEVDKRRKAAVPERGTLAVARAKS